MKNIFFVTGEYNIGGGESNLIDVASEFKRRNYNIVVLVPKRGDLEKKLDELGIKYINYSVLGHYPKRLKVFQIIPMLADIFAAIKIKLLIHNLGIKPDVIFSNSGISIFLSYILSKLLSTKLVWTCHGPWEAAKGIKARLIDFITDKTIAITPEINNLLECKNTCTIPLGINFPKKVISIENINKTKIKRILCVARFQKIKGQDILIKAYADLLKHIPDIELHFFGGFLNDNEENKKYFYSLKNIIKENNILESNIIFHGFCSNIREIMNEYDVVCIPSRYESFSIVTLEALNNGMTVVAPNIGGPSYIIEDKKSGFLFESGNSKDLADKLYNVLSNKECLNKKDILERAENFTIQKQVDRLIELLKNI